MSRFMARQGDILISEVDSIPSEAKGCKPEDGRLVLARGESTGHHHSVAVADGVELLTTADAAAMFLRTTAPTKLEHQEHGTITLPRGTFRITRQREYTPERPQWVAD